MQGWGKGSPKKEPETVCLSHDEVTVTRDGSYPRDCGGSSSHSESAQVGQACCGLALQTKRSCQKK